MVSAENRHFGSVFSAHPQSWQCRPRLSGSEGWGDFMDINF